jgi:hypothetical protein
MARSRSSFELTSAIAAASTLAKVEKKRPGAEELTQVRAPGLVSFQPPGEQQKITVPAPPGTAEDIETHGEAAFVEPQAEAPASAPAQKTTPAIPPPPPSTSAPSTPESADDDSKRKPPKLPDLSNVVSPIVRCERIVEWIAEATGGTGVFIADADGLPVAGDIQDAEARIGASGLVASSIATLLHALPGHPSPLFEVHIGEGPFFQLIGFTAAKGTYVVGLTRQAALSPRQAHAIRLACRHAFGEPMSGAAMGGKA